MQLAVLDLTEGMVSKRRVVEKHWASEATKGETGGQKSESVSEGETTAEKTKHVSKTNHTWLLTFVRRIMLQRGWTQQPDCAIQGDASQAMGGGGRNISLDELISRCPRRSSSFGMTHSVLKLSFLLKDLCRATMWPSPLWLGGVSLVMTFSSFGVSGYSLGGPRLLLKKLVKRERRGFPLLWRDPLRFEVELVTEGT